MVLKSTPGRRMPTDVHSVCWSAAPSRGPHLWDEVATAHSPCRLGEAGLRTVTIGSSLTTLRSRCMRSSRGQRVAGVIQVFGQHKLALLLPFLMLIFRINTIKTFEKGNKFIIQLVFSHFRVFLSKLSGEFTFL